MSCCNVICFRTPAQSLQAYCYWSETGHELQRLVHNEAVASSFRMPRYWYCSHGLCKQLHTLLCKCIRDSLEANTTLLLACCMLSRRHCVPCPLSRMAQHVMGPSQYPAYVSQISTAANGTTCTVYPAHVENNLSRMSSMLKTSEQGCLHLCKKQCSTGRLVMHQAIAIRLCKPAVDIIGQLVAQAMAERSIA